MNAPRRFALLSLAALTLLGVAACSSEPETDENAETADPAATPEPEPEPTEEPTWPDGDAPGTLANPIAIGEPIEDGDWSLTVDRVNLDGNEEAQDLTDGFVAEPPEGETWVVVEVTIAYHGSGQAEPGTTFGLATEDWTGIDDFDERHPSSTNNLNSLGPFENGSSETDYVMFQVPEEDATETSALTVVVDLQGSGADHVVSLT